MRLIGTGKLLEQETNLCLQDVVAIKVVAIKVVAIKRASILYTSKQTFLKVAKRVQQATLPSSELCIVFFHFFIFWASSLIFISGLHFTFPNTFLYFFVFHIVTQVHS